MRAKRNAAGRWAALRFSLGMAQMAAAVVAVTLLFTTGMNPWSLAVVVITCALTTVSVLLFREWPHRRLTNQRRRQRSGRILGALLIVWVWSCTDAPPGVDINRDMQRAEDLTVPRDVKTVERPPPSNQSRMSVQKIWGFTTGLTWEDYEGWVVPQLRDRGEFHFLKTTTETVLEFAKELPGDLYQIHVERLSTDRPLRIRVTFTAMPD